MPLGLVSLQRSAPPRPPPPERVLSGRRVNVDYAGPWAEKPWRYALAGNPWVSRPPLAPRPLAKRRRSR